LAAISQLERGISTDPHFSTLAGIAGATGTTVAALVGEEQTALPLAEAPQVAAWLRENGLEWGTAEDVEFREYVRGLDLGGVDEDGRPVSVMELGRDLTDEQDKAHELMWSPSKYRPLGPLLPVDPDASAAEQKRQRQAQLSELRKGLDRRYRRRAYALMRYAELLATQERDDGANGLWGQAWNEAA
jgi:transcriptional regulator with XRE-family HTH domain